MAFTHGSFRTFISDHLQIMVTTFPHRLSYSSALDNATFRSRAWESFLVSMNSKIFPAQHLILSIRFKPEHVCTMLLSVDRFLHLVESDRNRPLILYVRRAGIVFVLR